MTALQVALRDVVRKAVTPDMTLRIGRRDTATARADHQRQLRLVVPATRDSRVVADVIVGPDEGARSLGEECRGLGFGHVLPLALAFALLEMTPIVPADAQHVAPQSGQRRQKPDVAQLLSPQCATRQCRIDRLARRIAADDDVAQVPQRCRQDRHQAILKHTNTGSACLARSACRHETNKTHGRFLGASGVRQHSDRADLDQIVG